MTYLPNQALPKNPKILNLNLKQTKPNTLTLTELTRTLDIDGTYVNGNATEITIALKGGYEYLIETYSHERTKITNITSTDDKLVIKSNFSDLYRGYATFYLDTDTSITLYRTSFYFVINLGSATQSITMNEIIIYGVQS